MRHTGVRRDEAVPLVTRDRVTLMADVYRPAAAGRYPGLLLRVPYDRRVAQTAGGYAHPSWYAAHGFVVAVQDVRGRFGSGGLFDPFMAEAEDGAEAIEWLADLPACDGRVATYGYSYCGAIQLAAAARNPEPLAGVAPGFYSTAIRDEWAYPGGILALAFAAGWGLELAVGAARAAGEADRAARLEHAARSLATNLSRLPLTAAIAELEGECAPWPDWMLHEPDHDYWRRYDGMFSAAQVPSLHVGGWYDVFSRGTIAGFQEAQAERRLLMGPWWHSPWTWSPAAPAQRVNDRMLAWAQQLLHGASAVDLPPVEAFVIGGDEWLMESSWPPAGAEPRTFHLASDGRANGADGGGRLTDEPADGQEPADIYVYDPADPLRAPGGHSCCDPETAPMGPADQRPYESSMAVLVYTSPRFERDLLIAGPAAVTLFAASDCDETDFVVTLCAVDRHGRSTNLLEGAVRAAAGEAFEVREHRIPLGDVCARIPRGWALRLDVSSSRFPQWRRSANRADVCTAEATLSDVRTATNMVFHDAERASCVTLSTVTP